MSQEAKNQLELALLLNALVDEPHIMLLGCSEALLGDGIKFNCHFNEEKGLFVGKRAYARMHQLSSLFTNFICISNQTLKEIIEGSALSSYNISLLSQKIILMQGEKIELRLFFNKKEILYHSNILDNKGSIIEVSNFNKTIWSSVKDSKKEDLLLKPLTGIIKISNPSVFRLGILDLLKNEPDFFINKLLSQHPEFDSNSIKNLVRPNSFYGLVCRYLNNGSPRLYNHINGHQEKNNFFLFNQEVIQEINEIHNRMNNIIKGILIFD